MRIPILIICSVLLGSIFFPKYTSGQATYRNDFTAKNLNAWQIKQGDWNIRDGHLIADSGFSVLLSKQNPTTDLQASVDIAYDGHQPGAAAGIVFRYADDSTGYLACIREMEQGTTPEFGPWERPVLELYRLDPNGWKLLQESKVPNCWSGNLRKIKVICHDTNIWVYYDDMLTPVIKQHDTAYLRPGRVGFLKDQVGSGLFANFALGPVKQDPSPLPSQADWSWVRGAVYIRSDAVNAVQMWEDYWQQTDRLDRELSYLSTYGFNMVQVYLHWIVWDRHSAEYLERIDDFVARANHHHLQVNFVLWDDCGSVEPSLTFADPIPGRHNSQMMPNPSHLIRDSEVEMSSHQNTFRQYVQGIVGHFKDDKRISFWQIYNECMGPKEQYRDGIADANLNRLLDWTRQWVKETGTTIPITATGGGFYGPRYSDFYTYHSYRLDTTSTLPNADGGPDHLCTETLDRPFATLNTCIEQLAAKKNGFVVWEAMIGRDNCRFPWGHPDGPDEPTVPFHGIVYPDGHPWNVEEIKQLLGDKKFEALQSHVFQVQYFSGEFQTSLKKSITPRIDFELPDEKGAASPDASAGVPDHGYSIRWTGSWQAPPTGVYHLSADSDGAFRVWVDDVPALDHPVSIQKGKAYRLKAEYVHKAGRAIAHLRATGPGITNQIIDLSQNTGS